MYTDTSLKTSSLNKPLKKAEAKRMHVGVIKSKKLLQSFKQNENFRTIYERSGCKAC